MPQTTPLQGWSVLAGGDLPDMAAGLLGLGTAAEKQVNMRYTTTTARDAAITPSSARKAGMMAWVDANACYTMVLADSGAWKISPLGRLTYQADQSASFTFGTSLADVAGCSITLPAGQWDVTATGYLDYSTAAAQYYYLEIYDGTNTYFTWVYGLTSGRTPFTLQMRVDYSTSTTVKLHAYTSATSGVQGLANGRLIARPGMW